MNNPSNSENVQPSMVYVSESIQWEYRQLSSDTPPTEEILNELGKEQWELCAVVASNEKFIAYLKREK